jgi:hypothetical protein
VKFSVSAEAETYRSKRNVSESDMPVMLYWLKPIPLARRRYELWKTGPILIVFQMNPKCQ